MGTENFNDINNEVSTRVDLTKKRPFGPSLAADLKEAFFPDDPFRAFKDQSAGQRACSALQYYVPILEWVPKYSFAKFRYDLLAGVTIASLAIPQGISYARLAELPPIVGLYSSFVPPIVYAIFGSSKHLAVGTVAAASLLMASIIGNEVHPREEPQLYLELFFTAAFITGIFQLAMGVFRLGILIDFLARSTITGYMGGTAIIIILQQLKGLLGMTHFTQHTDVVSVLHAVFLYRKDWRWESFVLGIFFLCILLVTRHLRKAAPKLFWVSAITPLLLVIIGGLFTFLVHGQNHGIPIVGELKRGLNPISIGKLQFRSKHFDVAFKAGVIAGFIALAEGIAVGRSLAQATNDQVDGNKEMIAYGMMNIVGSFFSCYLTTGPFSKSAVNAHAGSRSQMSNIVQAFIMMLVLLLLAPLFKYTPLVVLSAIIITAMIGLIEYEEVYHLLKVDKFDFVICMTAFLGVIFSEMKTGLMMSVALSIVRALVYVARPHACKLGKISNLNGREIYRDIEQYPDAASVAGILILQLGSPVYFANSSYLRERISRWLEEEDNIAKKKGEEVLYVVLDLSGVSSIDNSGIGMLEEVNRTLQIKGIRLALANPRIRVVDKLVRSKVIDQIGSEWVFLTIKEAVKACLFSLEETKLKGQNP